MPLKNIIQSRFAQKTVIKLTIPSRFAQKIVIKLTIPSRFAQKTVIKLIIPSRFGHKKVLYVFHVTRSPRGIISTTSQFLSQVPNMHLLRIEPLTSQFLS